MPSKNKWCVVVMLCGAAEKENEEEEKSSWSEQFAMALTSAYAVQQSAAAAKCGVPSGEVWRTALETASNVGTKQVTAVSILYYVGIRASLLGFGLEGISTPTLRAHLKI